MSGLTIIPDEVTLLTKAPVLTKPAKHAPEIHPAAVPPVKPILAHLRTPVAARRPDPRRAASWLQCLLQGLISALNGSAAALLGGRAVTLNPRSS